jgi:hypothetical protein
MTNAAVCSLLFKDYDFRQHPAGFQAVKLYPNGFGISVIPESDGVTYEVAVLRHKNGTHSYLCYDSGVTDDVFRRLNVDKVEAVALRVRNLPEGTRVVR